MYTNFYLLYINRPFIRNQQNQLTRTIQCFIMVETFKQHVQYSVRFIRVFNEPPNYTSLLWKMHNVIAKLMMIGAA